MKKNSIMGRILRIFCLSFLLVFPVSGWQIPKGGKNVTVRIGERSDSGPLLAVIDGFISYILIPEERMEELCNLMGLRPPDRKSCIAS